MFLGGAVVYVLSMTQEAETEVKQAAPQLPPCAVRTAPVIGTIHGKRFAGPVRPQQNALLSVPNRRFWSRGEGPLAATSAAIRAPPGRGY